MKSKVLEVLKAARSDVDFEKEMKLIDDGILDSFDIITIVSDLNEKFDIDISADELEPENFNTLDAIVALVESMQ
jgi:acyl carrier protein